MPDKKDIQYLIVLFIIASPFYLLFLYEVPFQINTDEITIMLAMKNAMAEGIDILGPNTGYFGFPWFMFYIFGRLASFLGEISLYNTRLIHASSGILIILISYLFYRSFWEHFYSLLGALLLGFNHSFLAISRMAMRDNTGLLFGLASFTLLFGGIKSNSKFQTFLGGMVGGLTFYTYYPSRILFFLWLFFGLSAIYWFKNVIDSKKLKHLLIFGLLGFVLIITPIVLKTVTSNYDSFSYQKKQLLLFPEGRELQQSWIGATSSAEGVRKNIWSGLKMFNARLSDLGYIYPSPGHGFFDPLTGILIWVGLGFIIYTWFKHREVGLGDLFAIESFLIIWLFFTFITTKNPNYTRLLIILPFSSYLIISAVKKINLQSVWISILAVTVIITLNIGIFSDFIAKGILGGNDIGGTGRYIKIKKDESSHLFILVADNTYPYYRWGESWQWEVWMSFFADPNHETIVLSPENFNINTYPKPPFTIFLNSSLWSRHENAMLEKFPNLKIKDIETSGRILAIEVRD